MTLSVVEKEKAKGTWEETRPFKLTATILGWCCMWAHSTLWKPAFLSYTSAISPLICPSLPFWEHQLICDLLSYLSACLPSSCIVPVPSFVLALRKSLLWHCMHPPKELAPQPTSSCHPETLLSHQQLDRGWSLLLQSAHRCVNSIAIIVLKQGMLISSLFWLKTSSLISQKA